MTESGVAWEKEGEGLRTVPALCLWFSSLLVCMLEKIVSFR